MEVLTPAALFILVMARVPPLIRKGHDSVFYAALLTGAAALLTVPAAYVAADGLLGGHNVAKLAQHTMMVTGMWFIRYGIINAITPATEQRPPGLRLLPMFVIHFLQTIAFLAIGTGPTTTDFQGTYNTTLAGALYYSMVMLYSGWVCTEIAMVSKKFLPDMRGAFRTGFILVLLGGFSGVISSAAMIVDVLATAAPPLSALTFHGTPLQILFDLIPTALIGIGLTIPAVAGQRERSRTRTWERRAINRLKPISDRVLANAGTARTLQSDPEGTAPERLHRMIVQIWDAELSSGPESVLSPEDRAFLLEVETTLRRHAALPDRASSQTS